MELHNVDLTPSLRNLLAGVRDAQVTRSNQRHYFEGRRVDRELKELAVAHWVRMPAQTDTSTRPVKITPAGCSRLAHW